MSVGSTKHWANLLMVLEDKLKSRGFTEYYTCATDHNTFRFARLFGFDSAGEHIGELVEIMKKAID